MELKRIRFRIKRIGNHWYPSLDHTYLATPMFCKKAERYFNMLDKHRGEFEELIVELNETGIIVGTQDVLFFNDEDVTRFVTTDDDFYMRVAFNNHEFLIHSDLYQLLDSYFEFNRYDEYYRLSVL